MLWDIVIRYPDEIIPSEMANNGCPEEYLIAE